MKLIVCLDNRDGMLFNGRRQSRDRAVCKDILEISGKAHVWMHIDSTKLFDIACDRICCYQVAPDLVPEDVYLFLEFDSVEQYMQMADTLIIYRWNRVYPSDVTFPNDYMNCSWNLKETYEFSGQSHSRVTREVYVR